MKKKSKNVQEKKMEKKDEIEIVYDKFQCKILIIDPGPKEMGVCVIRPYQIPQISSLKEFCLDDYIPKQQKTNSIKKVMSHTIGPCVLNLINSEPEIFWMNDETPKKNFKVVIERQMNISTTNCCILSSFQTYYEANGVECHIIDPSILRREIPIIFSITTKSRQKRKSAIKKYGPKILTSREKYNVTKGIKKRSTKKIKSLDSLISIHALDAMFYGLVYCKTYQEIGIDIFNERMHKNPILMSELERTFKTQTNSNKKSKQKNPCENKNKISFYFFFLCFYL